MIELSHGIRLLSGNLFSYHEPHVGEVDILDIASPLSKICRFAGHIPVFYSVAQHAVNTSLIVPPEHAFTALMHDTAEAFMNDLPTPLKAAVPAFKALEEKIEADMARRFGFEYPLPPEVKLADLQMLAIEKHYIKADQSHWSVLDGIEWEHITDCHLMPWQPDVAREAFLERYFELKP